MTSKKNQTDLAVGAKQFPSRDMTGTEFRAALQRLGFKIDGGWYVTHPSVPEIKIGVAKLFLTNRAKLRLCADLLRDCNLAIRNLGGRNDPQRNA